MNTVLFERLLAWVESHAGREMSLALLVLMMPGVAAVGFFGSVVLGWRTD